MQYSKTYVKGHSQNNQKLGFKANYRLMQVENIAEILQYFRPS